MREPEETIFIDNHLRPYATDFIVPKVGRVMRLSSFAEIKEIPFKPYKGEVSLDIYSVIFGHSENPYVLAPYRFISIERIFWKNNGTFIELKPQLLKTPAYEFINNTHSRLFQCENLDLLLNVVFNRITGEFFGHVVLDAKDPETGELYKPSLDDFGVILKISDTNRNL